MPLDINAFRVTSGGDPEIIKESQRRRFAPVEVVDEIIAFDDKWRLMTGQIDNLRKERNIVQKGVATKMKVKEACEEGKAEIKAIGDHIVAVEEEQKALKIIIDKMVRHALFTENCQNDDHHNRYLMILASKLLHYLLH
jgi:seryl-tRNA synthetase